MQCASTDSSSSNTPSNRPNWSKFQNLTPTRPSDLEFPRRRKILTRRAVAHLRRNSRNRSCKANQISTSNRPDHAEIHDTNDDKSLQQCTLARIALSPQAPHQRAGIFLRREKRRAPGTMRGTYPNPHTFIGSAKIVQYHRVASTSACPASTLQVGGRIGSSCGLAALKSGYWFNPDQRPFLCLDVLDLHPRLGGVSEFTPSNSGSKVLEPSNSHYLSRCSRRSSP
ncbi:hypothetical protein EJ04DRAFT_175916 [Polyplosphaeria fusca]|uniref:Uncharacterized protein n=1 Tax=Polyplosphaeria fusca TaxID=682080 RepID=A0A9P4R3S5_9PLEO|nr:hypothetical protein EJ04DRAFT_175916 [Polyplosphaeria fusca]